MPFTIGGDWVSGPARSKKAKSLPVKVVLEKRGRSVVTVVRNLDCDVTELKNVAARLKKHCACGGTVKDGLIEIQGDKANMVRQYLDEEGIK